LMDLRMPVMDGLEATELLLADSGEDHSPVVIAMTANGQSSDRERCLNAGMADFLTKPIQAGDVREILKRYGFDTQTKQSAP
ncbi:response regulator, partial [Paenibacillus sepulcri]|nr:response regulator [Paenibacillus sepulcri]